MGHTPNPIGGAKSTLEFIERMMGLALRSDAETLVSLIVKGMTHHKYMKI